MPISWSSSAQANAVGDATMNFSLTNLNLAHWKPFMGDSIQAGTVSGRGQLVSQQGGGRLAFDLSAMLESLSLVAGANPLIGLGATLAAKGTATNLVLFSIPEYRFELRQQAQTLLSGSGAVIYDMTNEMVNANLQVRGALPGLARLVPQTNMSFSSGTLEASARFLKQKDKQTVTGNLVVTNLTGRIAETQVQNYGAAGDMEIGVEGDQVQIRKVNGRTINAGQPGGSFEVTGLYNLSNSAARINARLAGFNQHGLRPFIEPVLGERKLTSIDVNGNADIQYDPNAPSSIKAAIEVANLKVRDPKSSAQETPLAGKMTIDAAVNNQVTDIRECQLSLSPTARATNQVRLTGRVDMSRTNEIQGNSRCRRFARFHQLLRLYEASAAGRSQPGTQPGPVASAQKGPATPEKEPDAMQLPFKNFTAKATVRRLYLREVEIGDAELAIQLNGGHVLVETARLTLNGGPISSKADLHLDVPGFKYDVKLDARSVPLAPIVNSFTPERKGQLSGSFAAQGAVAGTGTTGVNLRRTLKGNFDFGSTNLNLSVANVRSPMLKALINVVTMIPDIARNPESAVGSFLSALGPSRPGTRGGLASELEKSPIDQITGRGTMGDGKVIIDKAYIRSPAFEAQAAGVIQLAPVLTNSTVQIPVSIALNRAVAERVNMVSDDTPTNVAYVKLPDFVTMKGTVGEPKTDINKVALAGTLLRGVAGALPAGEGRTGQLLNNLSGILSGSSGSNTNTAAAGTNAPANLGNVLGGLLGGKPARGGTNPATQGSPGGVLDGLLGPRASTNAPSTNQPAKGGAQNATNQNPVGNLLDQLLAPKK
jgi:hypothetical protein